MASVLRDLGGEQPGNYVSAAAWREANDQTRRSVAALRVCETGLQYADQDPGQQ
jgi:hypothetical protein